MRYMYELKHPDPVNVQTLVADYIDGTSVKVPYIDRISAVRWLLNQENMTNFDVVDFDEECWANYGIVEEAA